MTRVALYWAPDQDDPLANAGATWLGRDAELGAALAQPAVDGLAEATAAPRVYGFHATLRPPMRLATGWEEFIAVAEAVADAAVPFELPPLRVTDMSGFIALGLQAPCPALHKLADACVAGTDAHRLSAGAAELAMRRAPGLSPAQDALLLRWGYPYVMQEWRFHMTLSGRLAAPAMARLLPAAQAHFAPALAQPRRVAAVTVFTQRDGAAFLIADRLKLGGQRRG